MNSHLTTTPVSVSHWGDWAEILREEYRTAPLSDIGLEAVDLITQVLHQLGAGRRCSIRSKVHGEVFVVTTDALERRRFGCWRIASLELALSNSWIMMSGEKVSVTRSGIVAVDRAQAIAGFSLLDGSLEYLVDEYARSALGACTDRQLIPSVLLLSDLERRERNSDRTDSECVDDTVRFRSYRDGYEIGVPTPAYPTSLLDLLTLQRSIEDVGGSVVLTSSGATQLPAIQVAAETRLFGEQPLPRQDLIRVNKACNEAVEPLSNMEVTE